MSHFTAPIGNSTQKVWNFCEKCCHGNVEEMCAVSVFRDDCRKCPKPGKLRLTPCFIDRYLDFFFSRNIVFCKFTRGKGYRYYDYV